MLATGHGSTGWTLWGCLPVNTIKTIINKDPKISLPEDLYSNNCIWPCLSLQSHISKQMHKDNYSEQVVINSFYFVNLCFCVHSVPWATWINSNSHSVGAVRGRVVGVKYLLSASHELLWQEGGTFLLLALGDVIFTLARLLWWLLTIWNCRNMHKSFSLGELMNTTE